MLESKKKQACKTLNTLVKLSQNADESLWESYKLSLQKEYDQIRLSRLIFPIYSGKQEGTLRVSEQEARFAFVESIQKSNLLYSVETPTIKGYQLSGSKPRSAQTDLTVYDTNGNIFCNVEFKSKGLRPKKKETSPKPKSHFKIYKDLQKLLRESIPGLWFHVLESTYNNTITNLFEVFQSEMLDVYEKYKGDIGDKVIIFHICVLRHGFSVHKMCEVNESSITVPNLKQFFQLEYHVSKEELVNTKNKNGWNVNIK